MLRKGLSALTAILLFLSLGVSAAQAACTINGVAKVESTDKYYCDTDYVPSCAGWREVDLDQKRGWYAPPLRYMRIRLVDAGGVLDQVITDGDGLWSTTLPGADCGSRGPITIYYEFKRAHGADVNAPNPRWRFRISNTVNETWSSVKSVTLSSGSTHTDFQIIGTAPTASNKLANL